MPKTFDVSEADPQLWVDLRSDETYEFALDALVRHYQFLVDAMAYKFKCTVPSYIVDADLISYGQMGLLKAIARYDPEVGTFKKFSSTYIYGAIVDEFRSQDWAPRNLRKDQRTIRKAHAALRDENGTPSLGLVAEHLGWDQARIESTIRKVNNSHHQTLEGVDSILDSHTEPDAQSQVLSLCRKFVETMETFPPLSQLILVKVYFENMTLTQVSDSLRQPLTLVRKLHVEAVSEILDQMESEAVLT